MRREIETDNVHYLRDWWSVWSHFLPGRNSIIRCILFVTWPTISLIWMVIAVPVVSVAGVSLGRMYMFDIWSVLNHNQIYQTYQIARGIYDESCCAVTSHLRFKMSYISSDHISQLVHFCPVCCCVFWRVSILK